MKDNLYSYPFISKDERREINDECLPRHNGGRQISCKACQLWPAVVLNSTLTLQNKFKYQSDIHYFTLFAFHNINI